MARFVRASYGWLASVAIILGFVVAAVFFIAVVVGGDFGRDLALVGGEIMQWGIVIAAIAVGGGLIWMYRTGRHSLQVEIPSKPAAESADERRSAEE